MKKSNLLVVIVAVFVALFAVSSGASSCFAADVTIGGVLDVVYSGVGIDSGEDINADGNEKEMALFFTKLANVDLTLKIDENTEAFIRLDVDDFAGGASGVTSDSLLEEAKFTFKKVGGAPVNVIVGKQEVSFGLDKCVSITAPYVHKDAITATYLNGIYDFNGDGTNDIVPLFGEVNNKFAVIVAATPIPNDDTTKVELTVFQNDRGQDVSGVKEKPKDNGAQSFAVRLGSKRVAGLDMRVSYISMHSEGANNTAGNVDDSEAFSVGFDYEYALSDNKDVKIGLFGEAIAGYDLNNIKDYDQNIYHLGLSVAPMKAVTIVAQYNTALFKNNAQQIEPKLTKFSLTPKYRMENNVEFSLEYVRETLDADQEAIDNITADVVSASVCYGF